MTGGAGGVQEVCRSISGQCLLATQRLARVPAFSVNCFNPQVVAVHNATVVISVLLAKAANVQEVILCGRE